MMMVVSSIALAGLMALATDPIADSELFQSLDSDGDGQIAATELTESQRIWFARALRVNDRNKDGQLSQQELTGALTDPKPRNVSPGLAGQRRQFDPQRLDRNGDGMITLDEVPERGRERFQRMLDRTGRDSISVEAITQMRNQQMGRSGKANERPQIQGKARPNKTQGKGEQGGRGNIGESNGQRLLQSFRRLDANSDGKVTRAEARRTPQFVERLDKNGDGVVERSELPSRGKSGAREAAEDKSGKRRPGNQKGSTGPGQRSGGRRGMLERFDTNQDGQLSRSEVPQQMRARFDRIDRNGDGRISKQEMRTAADRRNGKPKSP